MNPFKIILRAAQHTVFLVTVVVACINVTQAQENTFSTQKISANLYMISGATGFTGGNIAVSVGADGVAVIDNGVASVLEKLRTEIAKITTQPVDYLINTHEHGDHTGNNAAFGADGTRLISHRNLRAGLIENGVGSGEQYVAPPADALPEITFNDEMSLYINGDVARLIHLSAAHTDGDAVIYFQNDNVIHTGDILFNGLFPYIDTDNGGSLAGMIAALKELSLLGDDNSVVIPGHGPLATKMDITTNLQMLEEARALVAKMIADGKSDDEIVAANPLAKFSSYHWGFITTERMIKQLLTALRS